MTRDELLYVVAHAEEAAGDRRREADDQDASEPGWGDENREADDEIEATAALLRKHAAAIVDLVTRLEAGPPPACGHSACRQHWIDSGDVACVGEPL